MYEDKFLFVSCNTAGGTNLLKCYKPDKVIVNNKEIKKVLIGIIDSKIKIEGVDCLLHKDII